jgi:integrase
MTSTGRRARKSYDPRIKEEPNGTYGFVIDVTPAGATERKQVRRRGIESKDEAQARLTELLGDVAKGTYVPPSRQTLGQYLQDTWLPTKRPPELRRSTYDSYCRLVRLHVVPRPIANVQLQKLEPAMLRSLYADLSAAGLSTRTVQYIGTVIHGALKQALDDRLIVRNPAELAKPRKPAGAAERREKRVTWSGRQVRTFLDATRTDRLGACWHLFAATGLRRGEVLGLTWDAVDFETGTLSITRTIVEVEAAEGREQSWQWSTPKTSTGNRRVALDEETVAVLRAHRKRQAAERLEVGEGYAADPNLVFCRPDGTVIHPKALSWHFHHAVRAVPSLPYLSLHGLRHTWATLAMAAGVPARVVQERLGHSDVSITLGTYSHPDAKMHADAAARVAALFGGLA